MKPRSHEFHLANLATNISHEINEATQGHEATKLI
jgi:hypothetical protein